MGLSHNSVERSALRRTLEFGCFRVALLTGRIWFSSPIIRDSQVGKGGLPPLPSQFERIEVQRGGKPPFPT